MSSVRISSFRRTVLTSAAFFLATFFGLEIGARVMDGEPLTLADNYITRDLGRSSFNGANNYDPLLGWVLAPGRKTGSPEYSFTTGDYGLRMHQFEIIAPQRGGVLAVGDSFAAGSEVSDQFTWPAQLESMLGVPVHNAGVGAYGVDQIVLRAETLIDKLQPDVLIVSPLADDSLRNTYARYGAPKPYFDIVDGKLDLRGVPVPTDIISSRELGLLRSILGHSYVLHKIMTQIGYYDVWIDNSLRYQQVHNNEMGTKISCLLMDRLVKIRNERGIRVLVMVQYGGPDSLGKEPPWYGQEVVECAREAGLQTIDTHPSLNAVSQRGIEAFQELYVMHDSNRVYGHMSPAGNHFIAELARTALGAQLESN